jgi:hypothetical protein
MFKIETVEKLIKLFIGLRPKVYAFEIENGETVKKVNGIGKMMLKNSYQ